MIHLCFGRTSHPWYCGRALASISQQLMSRKMNAVIPSTFLNYVPAVYPRQQCPSGEDAENHVDNHSIFVQNQLEIQRLARIQLLQEQAENKWRSFTNSIHLHQRHFPEANVHASPSLLIGVPIQLTPVPQYETLRRRLHTSSCANQNSQPDDLVLNKMLLGKDSKEGSDARQILAIESQSRNTAEPKSSVEDDGNGGNAAVSTSTDQSSSAVRQRQTRPQANNSRANADGQNTGPVRKVVRRCYKCGQIGHIAKNCTSVMGVRDRNRINLKQWREGHVMPHAAYNKIGEQIMSYYNSKKQTEDMYRRKMQLHRKLHAVIKLSFPDCELHVVGSSVNGFGSNDSDMDLCFMMSEEQMSMKETVRVLRILGSKLSLCGFLKDVKFVNAKVPILKFTDKESGIECDLNINSEVGVRNTHLLKGYSRMDRRVSPLVQFTKHWAKFHNINDAHHGSLSSYSLVLMVIHYLQVCREPPVIHSLQRLYPDTYNSKRPIRELSLTEGLPNYTSRNNSNLGTLFVGFLHYYSHVFDFYSTAISVRLGCILPNDEVARQGRAKPTSQWKHIRIEEPFNLSNTARAVRSEEAFMHIKFVFSTSYRKLETTRSVDSLFTQPF